MLQIPIIRNRGHRCAQAAMKSVLEYHSSARHTFAELDRLTGRKRDELTYPVQIAGAFLFMGIGFDYFTRKGSLERFLASDPENDMRKAYGEHAAAIMQHSNMESVRHCAEAVYRSGRFTEREPTLADLDCAIRDRNPPICLVNFDVLTGRKNQFRGHYLILHGFDEEHLHYGDSGPVSFSQSRAITRKEFLRVWKSMCWFDYDTVVPKGYAQARK